MRIPALAFMLLACSAPLGAQAIRVRVTEDSSGRPLAGAIVDVLDHRDSVVTHGLLSTDGRRMLALPSGGQFRVRLRRIGFRPFIGERIVLGERDTVEVALVAPSYRVALNAIVITARRCAADAFDDPGLSTVWEEVRKALTTTVLSREDSGLELEMRAFVRVLDEDRNVRTELVGLPRTTSAGRPYVALSADSLSKNGYVHGNSTGTEYFAPDEQVLLSYSFHSDHCFEVVRGKDAENGLLGVRFTPVERRRMNDIAGTIWIDEATAELRYLDFWYAFETIPRAARGEDRSGGQVVFERRPSGSWLVSAWRLRMPEFQEGRRINSMNALVGYQEFGGVVTPPASDTALPSAVLQPYRALLAPARVAGSVFDSLANRPMAGAHVWLLPIETQQTINDGLAIKHGRLAVQARADTADAQGHYELTGIPAGTYRLAYEHPDLDSLGLKTTRYDIRMRPGATVIGDIALPSRITLSQGCSLPTGSSERTLIGKDITGRLHSTEGGAYGGMVFGVVRSVVGEAPLTNALVRASWTDLAQLKIGTALAPIVVETRSDSVGLYRICGIPGGTVVTLQAAGPHSTTSEVTTTLGPLGFAHLNLMLAEVEEGTAAPSPGVLAGTVTDSVGHVMRETQVVVLGTTLEARTDSSGHFRIGEIPPGTVTVEVRRVGLVPARISVDVLPGVTTTVALTLTRAQLLDAMTVTAKRNTSSRDVSDAVRRHRSGFGTLITEEKLEQMSTLQDVVRTLPGVRTVAGTGGNQWVIYMPRRTADNPAGECEARVYVDGRETDYDQFQMFAPNEIAAVEIFVRPSQAPLYAQGWSRYGRSNLCGVVALWTKKN